MIFHNFISPSLPGITASINGTTSITNCVCCGTFATNSSTFSNFIAAGVTFEDNAVLLSGSSRIIGAQAAGLVGRSFEPMTRCFFAGTSEVLFQSSIHLGTITGEGLVGGENACNFNGYLLGTADSGGVFGEVDNTPNGCTGLYACGSFDIITRGGNDFGGRIIGNRAGGTILETYYYGSGDVLQLSLIHISEPTRPY